MSLKYSLSGHSGAIRNLISIDHLGLLASGSSDGSVKIWNLTNSSLKYSLNYILLGLAFYQKFSQVNSLAFENKLMLLGVGHIGIIRIWDLTLVRLKYELNSHTDYVKCLAG